MFRKLKNLLLYTGTDHYSYDVIKNKIYETNLSITTFLMIFVLMSLGVLLFLSFILEDIKQNRFVYLFGLISTLLILILSLTIAKKYKKFTIVLVFLTCSAFYLYGIILGAITNPKEKTIAFIIFLIVIPIIYLNRLIFKIFVTFFYVVIFIICCLIYEEGDTLSVDILNSILSAFWGLIMGTFVNSIKIKNFIFELKLHEMSFIDELTQTKNRNAYEFEYNDIPNFCKETLACIYVDVNGLHEINNEKGHEYGDKMLQTIASKIKSFLGEKYTYRVGGDEFIVFIPDITNTLLDQMISEMNENIKKENYHVAVGYEIAEVHNILINSLIKDAEIKMFNDKSLYYKNITYRNMRNGI